MRRFIILTVFAALAAAAEQYVYVDGAAVKTAPRALPSIGVDKRTGRAVLGLHAATDAIKAGCGWYRVAEPKTKTQVAENMVVASTTYQIDGHTVTPVHTYAERREITLQDRVNAIFANRATDEQIAEVLEAVAVSVTNKLATTKPIEIKPIKGGLAK